MFIETDIEGDSPFMYYEKEMHMLFTIGIILLALWLLGLVTSYTLGGFIYVALVIGIILLVAGFFRRGRTSTSHAHH